MGHKWDFIGIQLRQGDLVQQFRSELGGQKLLRIIDEWMDSEDEEVPVCADTVSRVLRSEAVRLGAVAEEFEKVKNAQLICRLHDYIHLTTHAGYLLCSNKG